MVVGKRIKGLRIAKGLTQEQLGALLGVKKAAVQKYESGNVENLKRTKILQLAEILESTPSYLMGWEDFDRRFNTKQLSEDSHLFDLVRARYGDAACTILYKLETLNEHGIHKLIDYLFDLVEQPKYLKTV